MIKKRSIWMLVCAVVVVLVGAQAFAATAPEWNPGTACHGAFGNTAGVDLDDYGAGNLSTTSSQWFMCPMIHGESWVAGSSSLTYTYISGADVFYKDQTTTDAVGCYTFKTWPTGSQGWGASKWSCNTTGGCATQVNSFSGNGKLTWASTEMASGSYTSSTYGNNEGFVCYVPTATSSGWSGRSFIIGYGETVYYNTL